ncbi:MAG: methyltransferase domain-containing protein [Vulcanimicrobiaceae bacterium]
MDDPVDSTPELEENLRDIARANRLFGGILPLTRVLERTDARTLLDVGCGAADVPKALLASAKKRGTPLAITCLDRSEQMLAIAARDGRGLDFVRGDAANLPFADGTFDVAVCTLTLHHFAEDDAVRMLREMRRVSRVTPVVCDLRRSHTAYLAARAFAGFLSRNRLTRNDAPASVLRSYTPPEALALARRAGWRNPHVRVERWFRMTLVDDGV